MIKTPDTDVEVIAIYHQQNIPATLILEAGTSQTKKRVNIQELRTKLGADLCKALPGLHAVTGCDTVSAFAGRGKKLALDLAAKPSLVKHLQDLGENFIRPSSELMAGIEKFVCKL